MFRTLLFLLLLIASVAMSLPAQQKKESPQPPSRMPVVSGQDAGESDLEKNGNEDKELQDRIDQLDALKNDIREFKEYMESSDYEGVVLEDAGKYLTAQESLVKILEEHIEALKSRDIGKINNATLKTHFAEYTSDIARMRFDLSYDQDDMKQSAGNAANLPAMKGYIKKHEEKGLAQIKIKQDMQKMQKQIDELEIEKAAISDDFDAAVEKMENTGDNKLAPRAI